MVDAFFLGYPSELVVKFAPIALETRGTTDLFEFCRTENDFYNNPDFQAKLGALFKTPRATDANSSSGCRTRPWRSWSSPIPQ